MEAKTKRKKKVIVDTTGWEHCTYEGVDYLIPPTSGLMEHRFEGIMVNIGTHGVIHTLEKMDYMIMPRSKEKLHFNYYLDCINLMHTAQGDNPIQLLLYKIGCSEPVSHHTFDANSQGFEGQCKDYTVKPGEYFIYVVNAIPCDNSAKRMKQFGKGFIYCFKVLENGIRMKHPEIDTMDVDNSQNLILGFKKAIHSEKDIFTCTCYDESFRVSAVSNVMTVLDMLDTTVKLPLVSKGWWLDGSYRIVVSHNGFPYCMIGFDWKNGTSENVRLMEFSIDSPYMNLQRHVRKFGYDSPFLKFGGCREMKLNLLTKRNENLFVEAYNYSVASPVEMDEYLLTRMFKVVYEERPIHFVDCKTIVEGFVQVKSINEMNPEFNMWDLVVIYNLSEIQDMNKALLDELYNYIQYENSFTTILYGTQEELDKLYEESAHWNRLVPVENRLYLEPYTVNELIHAAENYLNNRRISLSQDAQQALIRTFVKNKGKMGNWRQSDVEHWLKSDVLKNFKLRVLDADTQNTTTLNLLECEDIYKSKFFPADTSKVTSFENAMKELDELVGLDNIKRHLKRLFQQMAFQQKRAKLGLKNLKEVLPHMIFTGNPGTGKTTVARMVGKVFKDLGLLKEGKVITVDRSHLVGRYIGETEQKVQEQLEAAHGNVLFIDEAYSLCDNDKGDRKDYGCRVLECLLPILADPDNDILIILAGYEKEMNQMLELNPGMKGRFPYTFRFEDFTDGELNEMALRLMKRMDYVAEPSAVGYLRTCIGQAVKNKDRFFHNGRWVTQVVEKGILGAMSERLFDTEARDENRELFRTITEADVREGFAEMMPKAQEERRVVGFR